jgi:proteic killer suppression protein
MEVKFNDRTLAELEAATTTRRDLSPAIIKSFRKTTQFLRAAKDLRDVREMRGLRFEELKGDRAGEYSVRLNDQFRLVFRLDGTTTPPTICIDSIEDYH